MFMPLMYVLDYFIAKYLAWLSKDYQGVDYLGGL